MSELSKAEAQALTSRITSLAIQIRSNFEALRSLVQEAKDGDAHAVLGYKSWTAYLVDTLAADGPMALTAEGREELAEYLFGEGFSVRAVASVTGMSVGTAARRGTTVARPEEVVSLDGSRRTRPTGKAKPPVSDLSSDLNQAVASSEKPPAGWEPYAEEAGRIGEAIVRLPRPNATEHDLLIGAGFDPDQWRIAGAVNTRRWMRYDQEWLYYYKFDVVQGESTEAREVSVDELAAHLRKRKRNPLKAVGFPATSDVFAYLASDWQIGKRLGEDDSAKTAERVADTFDQAVQEVKALRKRGHVMDHGALLGLGDLGEGTCGFYPNQAFTIDLNRRDQNRVVRELITYGIDSLSPLFDKFTVATVGGNHGENRSLGGKVTTNEADNDDVAQFEAVREAFDRAGDPGITWVIPQDELSIQLNLGGVGVGMTHGHLYQRGKGGSAQGKALEWWKGQDFGGHELRGAQILLSAHFHHFSATTYGRKTHVQTPPMDPGSKWFADILGQDSPPGAVVMRFDNTQMLGFDNLRILEPGS